MKPDTLRQRQRYMTPRQLQRRKMLPVDKAGEFNAPDFHQNVSFKISGNSVIEKFKDEIVIRIKNADLNDIGAVEIEKALQMIRLPNLLNKNVDSMYQLVPAKRKMLHFALYMNNINHYSGGRYYLVFMAYLLASMGHKVTILSDKKAFFVNDFKFIDVGDRVEWFVEKSFHKTKGFLLSENNPFDYIIESPLAHVGFLYADKWKLPVFACLFESPNFVRKYRSGADSTEEYWEHYKRGILNNSTALISISNESMDNAKEWLEGYKGRFELVTPCINSEAADRVEDQEEENAIVFVGRHVEFKNPDGIINAMSKIPCEIRPIINYVGSHSAKLRERMLVNADAMGVNIRFYANVNDLEKFQIIKKSKMMVYPSCFEGFGIPPAEAIYCEKPCIVYDIPVLRREYGDSLDYVEVDNMNGIAEKVEYYLRNDKARKKRGEEAKRGFYSAVGCVPALPSYVKKSLRKVFYGDKDLSVTAGVIVLNGEDTIELALRSIYDFVDKIVIVEGAVEDYAKVNKGMITKDGHSIDRTIEIIDKFDDPCDKITLVVNDKLWKNKNEMQNEIAKRIDTDLYLKVDADEIFTEYDVEYMKRHFMTDSKLWSIGILKYEFWKGLDKVAVGGQWDRPQARMWRWRKDFRHPMDSKTGFNYFVDEAGKQVKSPDYKGTMLMEKLCYHLGYARNDDQIKAKINYYANRGIEVGVQDNYSDWKEGQPTNSTHPAGTTVAKFDGRLPLVLQEWYFKKVIVEPKEKFENNINMLASPALTKGSK